MELYADLTPTEKQKLLQFPAYMTLLAANADGKLDEREKQKAADFAHIKHYDSKEPLLVKYYSEVNAVFERDVEYLDSILPKDKHQREEAINHQLAELETILAKLGKAYGDAMQRSMLSFKEFVSKAHENVLEHFVFPFPIKGFTK